MGMFGFADLADPNADDASFDRWPAGPVQVAGIHSFISVDNDVDPALPTFVPGFNDQMQVRFRLMLADGKSGPPVSMTRAQIAGFVRALGGNIVKIKPHEESSGYLLRVQKELERVNPVSEGAAPKTTLTAVVNDQGWANVQGIEPPQGVYRFRFAGVASKNGQVNWRNWYDSEVVWINFELVSDEWGEPTPFDGYQMLIWFDRPFDGVYEMEDGRQVPRPVVTERGNYAASVRRLMRFMSAFAPTLSDGSSWEDYEWTTDPEESEYGVNELAEPMNVYFAEALKQGRLGLIEVGSNKSGTIRVLKLNSIMPVSDEDDDAVDIDAQTESELEQSAELESLVRFIEKAAKKIKPVVEDGVFEPTPADSNAINVSLTNEGAMWCRANILEAWVTLGLPKSNKFSDLSNTQAAELEAALRESLKEEEGF